MDRGFEVEGFEVEEKKKEPVEPYLRYYYKLVRRQQWLELL